MDQRLRAAVESAPSGLLMADGAGRIVLVNKEVERLFDYPREELLGQPIEILIPERLRTHHVNFRAAFHSSPSVRSMGAGRDLYGRRKDGSEVPIEIGLTPVPTTEGIFVLAAVVDISGRRQAEARFRVAVESSPSGMVMVDSQGKIILVNRAIEAMFGFRREELLGSSIDTLVPARFRQHHPVDRASFFADPRTRSMGAGRELFGLRKDGTEIPVEIGLNPIETPEGTLVLSTIVDISARKQAEAEHRELEEQLRQSQKLEAVGTLAGGIAHDFRNILNGIVGYGELLQAQLATSDAKEDLKELLRYAERGKDLVSRILTFTRRQESTRRSSPLKPAVEEAIRLLRSTLPATVAIETELSDVPSAAADMASIHQVVTNLGTNAAHAMPSGGKLEILLESHYVRDSLVRENRQLHEGDYAVLTVRDNGMGMDAATRARVFEPFFTTKAPGVGTGLGLAMVHGVMKDHGGAVILSSEPGKGTTVRCYFPLDQTETLSGQTATVVTPGAGQHILYVDDEPGLARIGERRLMHLGYRVTVVHNGRIALARFLTDPASFDAVVTDYTMPEMNGLELARELTTVRPELPIIMTTGYIDEFPPEAIAEAGVRRLIMKPMTIQELGDTLADILGIAPPS